MLPMGSQTNNVLKKTLNIAMVCDFFHPNVGGVESHIYALAQCLIRRGHRVVVITHAYGQELERQGVRYLPRGLKVYYIPMISFYKQVIFITVLGTLSVVRDILIREQVDILHGHSTFSTLSSEAILHAQSLGIPTVFSDHSLFGFADISSILMNKVVQYVLTNADEVICVSHTSKENTVLRAQFDPHRVYVIPNAVHASNFTPDPTARDPRYITVVMISRLVYRKGLDLLIAIIPPLCALFPELRFIVGGDGPKRLALEEVRERHQLHSRLQLVGSLEPDEVRQVLVQGDIFLNTSLTEAFCIAIIEAACCGLLVISTSVGGVPEVLPSEFIRLAPASASGLAKCLAEAICDLRHLHSSCSNGPKKLLQTRLGNSVNHPLNSASAGSRPLEQCKSSTSASGDQASECLAPLQSVDELIEERAWRMHNWVRAAYSWPQIAVRTERVYEAALKRPRRNLRERLAAFAGLGPVCGKVIITIMILHWLLLQLLCYVRPKEKIGVVPHLKSPSEDEIGSSTAME